MGIKIENVLPPSDLLERVQGIYAGLRQMRRLGAVGQYGFLLLAAIQIVVQSGLLPEPARGSIYEHSIHGLRIFSLLVLPLFILLFAWSKFWLKQSREPFRYTCSIEPFTPVPNSPEIRQLTWLSQDLKALLSQRIDRLRFGDGAGGPASGVQSEDAHIQIGGSYIVRPRSDEKDSLAVEIMPEVRIKAGDGAKKLAYPVIYPPDPKAQPLIANDQTGDRQPDQAQLKTSTYEAILERVYSSVATEIYRQIQEDVAGKIELMPTGYLSALALYHEAEDYARSSTLYAYIEAGKLYDLSARLFDPRLCPLPESPFRRRCASWRRALIRHRRRMILRAAPLRLRLAERELMCARAQIGFATMLLYQRVLAAITGQRINSVFEAHKLAKDALEKLKGLPADTPGRRETLFDVHVTLAIAYCYRYQQGSSEKELLSALALDPGRAEQDPRYLLVKGELSGPGEQVSRQAAEYAPRLENARWMVASQTERRWRQRPCLESGEADRALAEYQIVNDINPGNVGAWANRGYIEWLLGRAEEARTNFRQGRDYKSIKQETFVAELDYGLARIAAEEGLFQKACEAFEDATSGITSSFQDFRSYYFNQVGTGILRRFGEYKFNVERHLANGEKIGGLPGRVLNAVYGFVLNDYGECCLAYRQRCGDRLWLKKATDAFELAVLFNPELALAHYNLRRLRFPGLEARRATAEQIKEAENYDRKLQDLAPGWSTRVLLEAEAAALGAKHHREELEQAGRDVAEARKRLTELQARINQESIYKKALQKNGEGAKREPAGTERNKQAEPTAKQSGQGKRVNQARSDSDEQQQANRAAIGRLREQLKDVENDISNLGRKQADDLKKARELESTVRALIRNLVPHHWMWLDGADTRTPELNWDALENADPLNERRWEKQLNDHHVSALYTYARTLALVPDQQAKALRLFEHIRDYYWPENTALLQSLRDLAGNDKEAVRRCNAAINELTDRELAEDRGSGAAVWFLTDEAFGDKRRLDVFEATCARTDLNSELYNWLADELNQVARRARRKLLALAPFATRLEDTITQCGETGGQESEGSGESEAIAASQEVTGALEGIQRKLAEITQSDGDPRAGGLAPEAFEAALEELGSNLQILRRSMCNEAASANGRAAARACRQPLEDSLRTVRALIEDQREIEKRAKKPALDASRLAAESCDDPTLLWNISETCRQLQNFDLAVASCRRALGIDAQGTAAAADPENRRLRVDALRLAAGRSYAEAFAEFIEIERRPPVMVRVEADYLSRICAILTTHRGLEAAAEQLIQLCTLGGSWRSSLADAVVGLFDPTQDARDEPPLDAARFELADYLAAERRGLTTGSEPWNDSLEAGLMLARNLSPSLKNEHEAEMPGVTARHFLPIVTPVAIEYEKGVLTSDQGSSEVDRFLETLIPAMRERIERDTGIRVPGVRIRENENDMPKNTYLVMINEVPIVMGTLDRSKLFTPDKDIASRLERLPDYRAPQLSSYLPDGLWFDAALASEFYATEKRRIWDHLDYLTNHLENILRRRLGAFLGIQEVDDLLHEWAAKYPNDCDYLEGIRRDFGALARTARCLRALAEERASIGDPPRLLKGLRAVGELKESTQSIEALRLALSERLAGNDLNHTHFRLSDEIEGMLDRSISDGGHNLVISPEDLQEFLSALRTEIGYEQKNTALVVSIPRLRPFVRYIISSEWPDVPVLAGNELLPAIDYANLPAISL